MSQMELCALSAPCSSQLLLRELVEEDGVNKALFSSKTLQEYKIGNSNGHSMSFLSVCGVPYPKN